MRLPKISIITPSYNQAEFLEATIQSVLRQGYPGLEYLVVDGGSTDGSVDIIRNYEDQIDWWVSEPDKGQADAINKGFKRASGEIVAWLNSDDIYLPDALRNAAQAFEAFPECGLVYGDALSIDSAGRPFNKLQFQDWTYEDLLRFHIICQPSVFIRKSTLESAGYLDEDYHFMLDHFLWLKIAALSPIQHIPQLWSAARQHADAKNVNQPAGFSQEILKLLENIRNEPRFSEQFRRDKRRITGGAYRLCARYLLDGGESRRALKFYGIALRFWPRYALKHWHRMTYAIFSLVGGGSLSRYYYARRRAENANFVGDLQLQDWPGITIGSQSV